MKHETKLLKMNRTNSKNKKMPLKMDGHVR